MKELQESLRVFKAAVSKTAIKDDPSQEAFVDLSVEIQEFCTKLSKAAEVIEKEANKGIGNYSRDFYKAVSELGLYSYELGHNVDAIEDLAKR